MELKKNLITDSAILLMLVIQVPINLFFYLLYQPYVIRPYTNILYFFILIIIGCFSAKKYGRLTHLYKTDTSGLIAITWTSIAMVVLYLILKYRMKIFGAIPIFAKISKSQEGHWQFFAKPWLEINLIISVMGIFLVVTAMEVFYRAYIQELLGKYVSSTSALLIMAILSGLHSSVLGLPSGIVDFLLALIWGWVYLKSGLYSAIFVHMVWDILFIYFPGK